MQDIPQHFANLCALLIALNEYEMYFHQQLAHLPATFADSSIQTLTERERDVLKGLARGESEREMALRLNLTPATVHKHIQRLYNRLEVHSAQQAVLRASALRLVDWSDCEGEK